LNPLPAGRFSICQARSATTSPFCFADDNFTEQDVELFEAYVRLVKSAKRMVEAYVNLVKSAKSAKPLWFHSLLLHESPMCRAIMAELGGSVREYKRQLKHSETQFLRMLVNEAKARMRKNGERPKGGIDDAALDEVAEQEGLPSGAALKKQL